MKKLTEQQYFEIQAQYDIAMSSPWGGHHMILMAMLRKYGFTEISRETVLKFTERLLENGYRKHS